MMILEDWRFTSGHKNRCKAALESKKEGQGNVQPEPEQEQTCSDASNEKEKNDGSN
jgi:hypothetical protein